MLKLCRVKGKKTFAKIFVEGKKFRTDSINAFVCYRSNFHPENNIFNLFFAVSVSKKVIKKAVVRYRVKRLLRAGIRYALLQPEFIEKFVFIEYIVLIWKKPVSSPNLIKLYDVIPDLFEILKTATNYYKENLNDINKEYIDSNN